MVYIYWLLKRCPNWVRYAFNVWQEVTGQKKSGAFTDLDDELDFDPEIRLGAIEEEKEYLDLSSAIPQDQGQTMECVYFATGHKISSEETTKQRRLITFEGHNLTKGGIKYPGSFDSRQGDFLDAGLTSIIELGATDTTGKKYQFPDKKRINRSEIYSYLKAGQIVLSGVRCLRPLCDVTWFWRANKTGDGHAIAITGYDPIRKAYRVTNSWSEQWGYQWSGTFFIKEEDLGSLMPSYVFDV